MNLLLRDFEYTSNSEQIGEFKYPTYGDFTNQILEQEIYNYEPCPDCESYYLPEVGCDKCQYGTKITGNFDSLEENYINSLEEEYIKSLKQVKKPREKKSNYVLLDGSDKKIRQGVSYLKNSKKILQNSGEVRLKVGKRFFNVYFDYDIETFKDHTNTDDEASKIATNLRNVRVWEHGKKTNIGFYDEIKGIILKEILNNTHFNTNLL